MGFCNVGRGTYFTRSCLHEEKQGILLLHKFDNIFASPELNRCRESLGTLQGAQSVSGNKSFEKLTYHLNSSLSLTLYRFSNAFSFKKKLLSWRVLYSHAKQTKLNFLEHYNRLFYAIEEVWISNSCYAELLGCSWKLYFILK